MDNIFELIFRCPYTYVCLGFAYLIFTAVKVLDRFLSKGVFYEF